MPLPDDDEETSPTTQQMDADSWFVGDDDDAPAADVVVVVWSINAPTIAAFQRCELSGLAGGFGVIWQGFSSLEIESAMRQVGIAAADTMTVSADLHNLGRIVAAGMNARQRARSGQ